jgi:hypothetical protein
MVVWCGAVLPDPKRGANRKKARKRLAALFNL